MKNPLKTKWFWIVVVIVVVVGGIILARRGTSSSKIQTAMVTRQDLQQTVLSTGQVTSSTDLNLSFQTSGVADKVNVVEGQAVKQGDVLAVLDQSSAQATATSAQGTLAAAQANYEKVVAGSSDTQIAVSEKAVASAQVALQNAQTNLTTVTSSQATAVQNAYSALLNTAITAVPGGGNSDTVVPIITGTYTGTTAGVYNVSLYTADGFHFTTSGLEKTTGRVTAQPVPLGSDGLFIQFNQSPIVDDTWMVTIPNTADPQYTANQNAYQAALKNQTAQISGAQSQVSTAQAALDQSQADLAQTESKATSADIDAAKAQILSAQGQVEAAQSTLAHTIITAPTDGTITQVDIKVGEQATALQEVMVLQDVKDLHVEAEVSEADIASLQVGQTVDYTFDALGPDAPFSGTITTINPASTVISGVVDYKVTASVENAPNIKPGMTANMTTLFATSKQALAVPAGAVIDQNGMEYVRVVDDVSKGTYHQVQVQTGLQADGGLTEITSGLTEGETIVTSLTP